MSAPFVDAPAVWPCLKCGVLTPEPEAHGCEDAQRERHERRLFAQGSARIEEAMRAKVMSVGQDPSSFGRMPPEAALLLALWVHFKQ
jgi:hypothetical protein